MSKRTKKPRVPAHHEPEVLKRAPLVVLTEDEREQVALAYNDPGAWSYVQGKANRDAAAALHTVAHALELTAKHPTHPACVRLRDALLSVLVGKLVP